MPEQTPKTPPAPPAVQAATMTIVKHIIESGAACFSQTGYASDGRAMWLFAIIDDPETIRQIGAEIGPLLERAGVVSGGKQQYSAEVTIRRPGGAK